MYENALPLFVAQSVDQYLYHIRFKQLGLDLLFTAMPAFDAAHRVQHDQDNRRSVDIFYFTSLYALFDDRSNALAVCPALALHVAQVRIGKVFPLAVAYIYFFVIVDHLPDMETQN